MPKNEKPASTQRSRWPGTGPMRGRPSGVYPSGPLIVFEIGVSARTGTRRSAASRFCVMRRRSGRRSRLDQPRGTPSSAQATRVGLERAEKQSFAVLAHVERSLGIAEHGQLRRTGREPGDGLGEHVLVLERDDRQLEPERPAELARPHAGRDHHVAGAHSAARGLEAPPALVPLQGGDGRPAQDPRPTPLRFPGEPVRDRGGIDPAVGRQVRDGEQPVRVEQRKQLGRALRRDDLERDADLIGDAFDVTELIDSIGRGREAQGAGLVVGDVERAVELDAASQQGAEVVAPGVLRAQTGRVPGGAGRELVLLEQHDVRLPEAGQVVGEAATGDAAADDRDPGLGEHGLRLANRALDSRQEPAALAKRALRGPPQAPDR